jgi:hypothetical protein
MDSPAKVPRAGYLAQDHRTSTASRLCHPVPAVTRGHQGAPLQLKQGPREPPGCAAAASDRLETRRTGRPSLLAQGTRGREGPLQQLCTPRPPKPPTACGPYQVPWRRSTTTAVSISCYPMMIARPFHNHHHGRLTCLVSSSAVVFLPCPRLAVEFPHRPGYPQSFPPPSSRNPLA